MNAEQINNIEKVLKFDKNATIVDTKIGRLTAPGENYGSLMLSVDLTVKKEDKCEEIKLVAKKLPPNEFLQKVFNTNVTYPKEVGFYKTIVPLLKQLQIENGIKDTLDFVPEYYGSRLNLADDDGKVDEDAVLILENLKIRNFVVPNRMTGVDLQVAKLILTDLAYLHAAPIALKLQKNDIFENKVVPLLTAWESFPDHMKKLTDDLKRVINSSKKLQQLEELILEEFKQQMVLKKTVEPFATIVHNDCWLNNTMVQFNGTTAVNTKLLDYQVFGYGSPARDIIFFLFTSLKLEVFEKNYEELILFYHEKFISILQQLHCDVSRFSLKAFQNEMDREGRNSQFAHIAFMLFVVYAEPKEVKNVEEMTSENIVSENISNLLSEKFVWFVEEFLKRGWIFNK